MMKFRGMELDFDIYDADTAELYEAAVDRFAAENAREVSGESLSEGIRRRCGTVFEFFDTLFGEGFHKELFGGKTNLGECIDVFAEFKDLVNGQAAAMAERAKKYAPDRAERRAAAHLRPAAR